MKMPQMGGLEFLSRLRAAPGLEPLPVGVITGDYFLGEAVLQELGHLGAIRPVQADPHGRSGGADRPAARADRLSVRADGVMTPNGSIHILGVPLDLGGGRRGVDMGPSAVRIAGLGERLAGMGLTVVDKGNLDAPIPETRAERDPEEEIRARNRARLPEALPAGLRVARGEARADRARRRSLPGRRIGRAPPRTLRPRRGRRSACCGLTRTAT